MSLALSLYQYVLCARPRQPRSAWNGCGKFGNVHLSETMIHQFHNSQGKMVTVLISGGNRIEERFLKGSFLASQIDIFFGDGVGGFPCNTTVTQSLVGNRIQYHLSDSWKGSRSLQNRSSLDGSTTPATPRFRRHGTASRQRGSA